MLIVTAEVVDELQQNNTTTTSGAAAVVLLQFMMIVYYPVIQPRLARLSSVVVLLIRLRLIRRRC